MRTLSGCSRQIVRCREMEAGLKSRVDPEDTKVR
jgi:hypothetical protein